ncbi:hypothetical protein Gogos_012105 [Gossypium gossypioides]|uniref:RNase H type-1 domain-containing protein n=1 Tax=Gossypium gossypioides TaxID=34282 RepID=A0A7J9BRF9_GOSGO|nr:hypothetical protein [Gossypium gossypioides]
MIMMTNQLVQDICCRKPGLGKLKCNVDGATFADNGCMGWAVVLRNDEDNVVMETDSQRLWQAFHHDYEDASYTSLVLKDYVTIDSAFQSSSLCWIRNGANKATHVLVRGALLRVNYMNCTIYLFIARIINAKKLSNLNVKEGS